MVTFGSLFTIFGKIMDLKVYLPTTVKDEDGSFLLKETRFKHPLIMTLLMFMGEVGLLCVLRFRLLMDPVAAAAYAKNKASPWLFASPACMDFFGSFFNFMGLALISASSYQILKMLNVVFVVVLSITFLRKSYS